MEFLAGGLPDEVVVLSTGGLPRWCVEGLGLLSESLGLVFSAESLGEDFLAWREAPGRLGLDVIDVTPGRKMFAVALVLGAISSGTEVRYLLMRDEGIYGYSYFGFAPPHALSLMSLHPEARPLGFREPDLSGVRALRTPVSVGVEVVHALVNVGRYLGGGEVVIKACGSRAVLEPGERGLRIKEVVEDWAAPRASRGAGSAGLDDLLWCVESGLELGGLGAAVRVLESCVSDGCWVVPDTNVWMRGHVQILGRRVRGLGRRLMMPEPVAAEILRYLELKHGAGGARRFLGFIHAARSSIMPDARRGARCGDEEIARAVKDLSMSSGCACLITEDSRLASLLKPIKSVRVAYLGLPKTLEGAVFMEDALPNLILCAALTCGELKVASGPVEMTVRSLKPHEIDPRKPSLKLVSVSRPALAALTKALTELTLDTAPHQPPTQV